MGRVAQFAAHGLEEETADVIPDLAPDTETYPIAPWCAAPKVVCVSIADATQEFLFRESPVEFLARRTVWHNAAYDMSCIAATWPETLPEIVEAYEKDLVEDTMLIQKLQDNAVGILRGFDFDEEEGPTKIDYELDSLGKRHEVGRKVQTEWMKKEKNPHAPGTLEHWKWSCEHFRFWELDALPLDFWPKEAVLYAKTDARVTYDVRVAQEDCMELCPDHHFQARAAFWLQLMAVHGICTDGPGVEAFAEQTNIDRKLVKERLVEAKLIRPDRALKSGPRKGTIIEGSRDTKLAAARIEKGFTDQGRQAPITDGGKISTSRAACKESGDALMLDYAEFAELNAVIKKDIPALRLGMTYPIHTRIDTILATGRPSSSKPNIFNIRRKAGVRECFVPRPGKVFISADNGGMELCTLAESMCVLFGRSTLADALNEGRDPHLDVAAQLLQISSSEAAAIYSNEDHPKYAWVKNGRQVGKVANFGFPGGLGAETFVHFALQSYDVKLTLDQAHEAKRAWLEAWPDMHNFFAHVSQLVDNDEPVVLPYSGFRRGRASYCAACNTFFQGPGASIFKTQGWLVMKACYFLDPSPLFGSRIANGIYDELILEVDDGTEHESAEELKGLMQEGAKPWLRHVRMKIDAVAMRRWSKDAKKIYKDGRLTAWCSHGVMFDEKAAKKMRKEEIRRRWPRLEGRCPLGHGCRFEGVHYASERHQEAWG